MLGNVRILFSKSVIKALSRGAQHGFPRLIRSANRPEIRSGEEIKLSIRSSDVEGQMGAAITGETDYFNFNSALMYPFGYRCKEKGDLIFTPAISHMIIEAMQSSLSLQIVATKDDAYNCVQSISIRR